MGKTTLYINYLKEINPIKEYLKDTSISDKSIKTYLQAIDKIFPYLVDRFKEKIGITFSLEKYYEQITINERENTNKKNEIRKNWEQNDIPNKVFNEWRQISQNKKANLLMKFANQLASKYKDTNRNSFVNYIWRIQGFLAKLGRDYEANPKIMEKTEMNGFHLEETTTYEDVLQFYEKINNPKYKLILKIMMYSGLNPIDIIALKPIDFKRFQKSDYYYIMKKRIKTMHKDTYFVIAFHTIFINEIKEYFERTIIKHYKKATQQDKIEKYMKHPNFEVIENKPNYVKFKGQYNWNTNKKQKIFGNIASKTVSDTFRYHIKKDKLNPDLMPMNIRRLSFTRLLDVFSLKDRDIYDIWTQHKAGIITRSYTIDLLTRTIPYLEKGKVQDAVLIGTIGSFIRELNGYKNGMNRIKDLEKENKDLKNEITEIKATQEQIQLLLRSIARTKDKEIKISDKPITNKEYIEILNKENKKSK